MPVPLAPEGSRAHKIQVALLDIYDEQNGTGFTEIMGALLSMFSPALRQKFVSEGLIMAVQNDEARMM